MIGKSEAYRRVIRALGLIAILAGSQRALAQEPAVTRIDLPLGRSYPYRAAEVITRVTVANPAVVDAVVVSERELVLNAASAGEGDISFGATTSSTRPRATLAYRRRPDS